MLSKTLTLPVDGHNGNGGSVKNGMRVINFEWPNDIPVGFRTENQK